MSAILLRSLGVKSQHTEEVGYKGFKIKGYSHVLEKRKTATGSWAVCLDGGRRLSRATRIPPKRMLIYH